jgi:hypothetical protein
MFMKGSELSEIISRFPVPEIKDSDTDEDLDYVETRDFEIKTANDIFNEVTEDYAGEEQDSCHITPLQATLISAMFLQYSIDNSKGSAVSKQEILDVIKKLAEVNGVEFDKPLSPALIEEGQYLH